jgi:O-antigen/teichoic acid export membrane protein
MKLVATRQEFARNLTSGWVLLSAEVAVAFLLTPFIVRELGAAAYGIWSLMFSVIGYMGLIDIGIRGSVGRYVNHYMAQRDARAVGQVVGTALVVLTALAAVCLAASFFVAHWFVVIFPKTPPELHGAIQFCLPMMAFGLWLAFVSSVLGNLLQAKEALYLNNRYNLWLLLARAAGTVAVLNAGLGLEGLMLVTTGLSVVGTLFLLRLTRRVMGNEMPTLTGFSLERLREMWRFGVASFVSRTASTMANDSAPLIGMWVLGPEAVAVYSLAMTLAQYTRRLIDMANTAIFPSVMKSGGVRDMPALRQLYLRFMNISFAVGSLVFIGLIVFGGDFLALWVGPGFAAGGWVAGILAIGYLAHGVASTAPLTLQSLDRIGVTVKIGVAEAVACVVLTAALPALLGWGLVGMALGATLPRLVSCLVVYPWLALTSMGPELWAGMRRGLVHNAALCVGVALAFVLVHWLVPADTWPGLVGGVLLVVTLHVLLLGHRYEAFPLVEQLQSRALHGMRRLWRGPA